MSSSVKIVHQKRVMDYAKPINEISKEYDILNDEDKGSTEELRKQNYDKLSLSYYFMTGAFYYHWWGMSWHFAPRHKWETFESSIQRHEVWLAYKLKIEENMTVLDAGCGIGGPMRSIARFTRASIWGINNDPYQIVKAKQLNEGLSFMKKCRVVRGDFMKMPLRSNSFDVVYQIEASVHAPSKVGFYEEVFRVLKPGGIYGGFEWTMTEKYDENNPEHNQIKRDVAKSNGVPTIDKEGVWLSALKQVGFEIIEHYDMAEMKEESDYYWYKQLEVPYYSWKRRFWGNVVWFNESIGLAKEGTYTAWNLMQLTISSVLKAGQLEIFSPLHYVKVRKPLETE